MTEKPTIILPLRKVTKRSDPDSRDLLYFVIEMTGTGDWQTVSKGYQHSTSAFAALGRLVQKDTLEG
jgi:hypothetical protein